MTVEQLAREIHDFMRTWEIASRFGEPEQCALAMAKAKVLWCRAREIMNGTAKFMDMQPTDLSRHGK